MSNRNNVYDEPLCPTCGELLELIECNEPPELDHNFFDYVKSCVGVCPKCDKAFGWLEVWDYKGVTNIKEIPHDDEDELDDGLGPAIIDFEP